MDAWLLQLHSEEWWENVPSEAVDDAKCICSGRRQKSSVTWLYSILSYKTMPNRIAHQPYPLFTFTCNGFLPHGSNIQEFNVVHLYSIFSYNIAKENSPPVPFLAYFYRHWTLSPQQVSMVSHCRSPHTFHSWVPWCCVCTHSGRAPCQACPPRQARGGTERHDHSRSRTLSPPCHRWHSSISPASGSNKQGMFSNLYTPFQFVIMSEIKLLWKNRAVA